MSKVSTVTTRPRRASGVDHAVASAGRRAYLESQYESGSHRAQVDFSWADTTNALEVGQFKVLQSAWTAAYRPTQYSWPENADRLQSFAAMLAASRGYIERSDGPEKSVHPAVRHAPSEAGQPGQGYYVARSYRALWFTLLIVALVWGVISGFSLSTGSFLSVSGVLMGIFGCLVLAATLVTAGSRERIRRHHQ